MFLFLFFRYFFIIGIVEYLYLHLDFCFDDDDDESESQSSYLEFTNVSEHFCVGSAGFVLLGNEHGSISVSYTHLTLPTKRIV